MILDDRRAALAAVAAFVLGLATTALAQTAPADYSDDTALPAGRRGERIRQVLEAVVDVVRERVYAKAAMPASDSCDIDLVVPNLAIGKGRLASPASAERLWAAKPELASPDCGFGFAVGRRDGARGAEAPRGRRPHPLRVAGPASSRPHRATPFASWRCNGGRPSGGSSSRRRR